MSYEYHREIKRTESLMLVKGANGFMIWTHKNGRLKKPISEGYSHIGEALQRMMELEDGSV